MAKQDDWLIEREKLNILTELCADRLDELLDNFDVKLRKSGKLLTGKCPVHSGDNYSAFNLYPEGHSIRCLWKCRTKCCHEIFKGTLIGLVRGLLSRDNGWDYTDKYTGVASFAATKQYLLDFIGQKWNDLKPDIILGEKKNFVLTSNLLGILNKQGKQSWTREQIGSWIKCPSEYYINRGYGKDLLNNYLIGDSKQKDESHLFFNRAVVPVFDNDGKLVIGAAGRTLNPQCKLCNLHHNKNELCPTKEYKHLPRYAKWINSLGFSRENYLYNYWNAKKHIKEKSEVLLVESPNDVLSLLTADINNCVALFGTDLTDAQEIILESSGALKVICLTNNDESGIIAGRKIKDKLKRIFNVDILIPPKKDLAEMDTKDLKELLK